MTLKNNEQKSDAENVDDDKITLAYEKLKESKNVDDYDAIKLLDEAIEINPNLVEAYFDRACIYWDLKQYEQAIQNFDKVIEINPGDTGAYLSRGKVYQEMGQYEKALQDYNEVLENYPLSDSESYYNRGDELFTLYGCDTEPYCLRGDVYMKLEQYEKAIRDYDTAILISRYLNDFDRVSDHKRKLCYEELDK